MKILTRLISLVVIISFVSACSSKKAASPLDPGYLSESDLNSQLEGRYADGSIPLAEGEGPFRTVNFGYNSSAVDDVGRQNIDYNVEILKANNDVKVILEGHCDERGTAEYNIALGADRALQVSKILQSYGISGDRIKTISYGEEVPFVQGHDEEAWAKNRRVHFSPHR